MGFCRVPRELFWHFSTLTRHETTISTFQDSPQAAARVFEPQLEEERARDLAQSPPRGPETVDAGIILNLHGMSEAPVRLGLPRSRRIKQGRDFQRTKTQGKRLVSGCLIANWAVLPAGAESRLGVITGRKLGKAVVRTRARRLLREAYRLNQLQLTQPIDLVLVARHSIVGKAYKEVESDLMSALRRGKLIKGTE
jgi:ribonuclease P protein component